MLIVCFFWAAVHKGTGFSSQCHGTEKNSKSSHCRSWYMKIFGVFDLFKDLMAKGVFWESTNQLIAFLTLFLCFILEVVILDCHVYPVIYIYHMESNHLKKTHKAQLLDFFSELSVTSHRVHHWTEFKALRCDWKLWTECFCKSTKCLKGALWILLILLTFKLTPQKSSCVSSRHNKRVKCIPFLPHEVFAGLIVDRIWNHRCWSPC